jgi:hypothetical protein
VARVAADDANDALALDDLALRADGFDAGSNFHGACSLGLVVSGEVSKPKRPKPKRRGELGMRVRGLAAVRKLAEFGRLAEFGS